MRHQLRRLLAPSSPSRTPRAVALVVTVTCLVATPSWVTTAGGVPNRPTIPVIVSFSANPVGLPAKGGAVRLKARVKHALLCRFVGPQDISVPCAQGVVEATVRFWANISSSPEHHQVAFIATNGKHAARRLLAVTEVGQAPTTTTTALPAAPTTVPSTTTTGAVGTITPYPPCTVPCTAQLPQPNPTGLASLSVNQAGISTCAPGGQCQTASNEQVYVVNVTECAGAAGAAPAATINNFSLSMAGSQYQNDWRLDPVTNDAALPAVLGYYTTAAPGQCVTANVYYDVSWIFVLGVGFYVGNSFYGFNTYKQGGQPG